MKFSTIFSASAVVVAALTNLVSADTIFIQELQSPAGDRHSVGILDIGTGDKSLGENIGLVWFDNDLAVPNTGGGTPMGTQTGHCVEVWVGKNLACYFNFKLDTPDGLQGNILAEALFDLENFPDAELVITGGSGDFLGIVGTGVTSAPADFDGTTFFYTFDYDFVPIKGGGNRQLRGDATSFQSTVLRHHRDLGVELFPGTVQRQLVITGHGYLMERDGAGVVNCRPLSQLHAIVRVPKQDLTQSLLRTGGNQQQQRQEESNRNPPDAAALASGGDQLVLEFTNGTTCTYTSSNRDALLVSLLDATMTLAKKTTVQISDVQCAGYCLSSLEDDTEVEAAPSSAASALFQPISIPIHCMKRVYAVSTAAYAYVTHAGEVLEQAAVPVNVAQECQ
ncbi:MAG: hypothetical protein SGILL_010136, partial [Bacillariaceae sp.]